MRKAFLALALLLLLALLSGIAVLRTGSPPELAWRLQVVLAKLRGDLPDMPLANLIGWLAPGSPVYLEGLADVQNPHSAIRNMLIDNRAIEAGREAYAKHCGQCHGENARGNSGPDLVSAVALRPDWSFFATVKWGRQGTAMLPQPLGDARIWEVHAFLREEALRHYASAAAGTDAEPREPVNVLPDEILDSDRDPSQWLTYAGNYRGHRHGRLAQITRQNVGDLRVAWVAQLRSGRNPLQASPIVADGTVYVTESPEGVIALDAKTGESIWAFSRPVPDKLPLCCGSPNRGVAINGSTVFAATLDAHLVALDANTGKQRWIVKVADYHEGYSMTGAPLALADRVLVGVAGGEFGIRGFLAAFDAIDGRLLWKFNTVPGPGEPGHDTWAGDSWKTGGAPTWTVGAYDRGQDLVIWGVGNPGPPLQAAKRAGDNLYSNSVVAVDAGSGKLRWHYQFTPRDEHDWDAVQQPVLGEVMWHGAMKPVVLWANRNGFFYALDRVNGEFLSAKPFVKQTWAEGFDARGRPIIAPGSRPSKAGSLVWPAVGGATNWWPPSYDPSRQLVFVPGVEAASLYFQSDEVVFEQGELFFGSSASPAPYQPAAAYLMALDAHTGNARWQVTLESGAEDVLRAVGGVLSTATGIVFLGYRDRFFAFDADTGEELWTIRLGARIGGPPITYEVAGMQHIAVMAGHSLFTFALPVRQTQ